MGYDVLHVTPFYPPNKGGISYHVYNIRHHLVKHGHHVDILCPRHLTAKSILSIEEDVHRIRSIFLPGWPYPTMRSVSIPLSFGIVIDSILKNKSYDLVHVHGHHFPLSWIAINSAHKRKIPIVLSLHGSFALNPYKLGGRSSIEEWLNKYFFPKIFNKTIAVVGLTNQLTNYGKTISKKPRYYTIGNGVDTIKYVQNMTFRQDFRKKYGLNPEAKVLLFVGRFEHVKGIIELANAVKILVGKFDKKIEVIIAGQGTLKSKVHNILNLTKQVILLDWQDQEKIHELYIAADIFILPSRFEALPLTVIEAMNAGLHIVYTDVGGVADILQPYENKTLLTEVSAQEITNVLDKLVSSNANINSSPQSMKYARSFDWKHIAYELNDIYLSILNGDGSHIFEHVP